MNGILIVEDNSLAVIRLDNFLKEEGYIVSDTIFNSKDVYVRAIESDINLILMDISLNDNSNDISGIKIAEKIRSTKNTPIIFITSNLKKDIMQKTIHIENSAFLNKPWRELELLSQIETFLKKPGIINLDDEFSFNLDTLELKKLGKHINLNRQQLELLKFFIENQNNLLTNEVIEQRIWNDKEVLDTTRISLVSQLRKKLDGKFITTSHCRGYIFKI